MTIHTNAGIWAIWGNASAGASNPLTKGGLHTILWKDVETSYNNFNWGTLLNVVNLYMAQGKKVILGVPLWQHGGDAPSWIFNSPHNCTQVTLTNSAAICAYPLDAGNNFRDTYWHFIEEFVDWIDGLSPTQKATIEGIKALTGSSGDIQAYPGTPTNSNYAIDYTGSTWRNWRYSVIEKFDDELQAHGLTNIKVHVNVARPANPENWDDAVAEYTYINANVTADMIFKVPSPGHRINNSTEELWVEFIPTRQVANHQLMRDELDQVHKPSLQNHFEWNIYWQALGILHGRIPIWNWKDFHILDDHPAAMNYAANFFNEYAPYVHDEAGETPAAWVAFRDSLDANDTSRFPTGTYGNWIGNNPSGAPSVGAGDPFTFIRPTGFQSTSDTGDAKTNKDRMAAIVAAYASKGAVYPDREHSLMGRQVWWSEAQNINDVTFHVYPGNYEFYLSQLNVDSTSEGWWRVGHYTEVYGRFARSPKVGQNILVAADSQFITTGTDVDIEVTYYDDDTAQFSITHHDSASSKTVTKTNTDTWKKTTLSVDGATFTGSGPSGADISLATVSGSPTKFHMVRVVRGDETGGPPPPPPDDGITKQGSLSATDPASGNGPFQLTHYWDPATHQAIVIGISTENTETVSSVTVAGSNATLVGQASANTSYPRRALVYGIMAEDLPVTAGNITIEVTPSNWIVQGAIVAQSIASEDLDIKPIAYWDVYTNYSDASVNQLAVSTTSDPDAGAFLFAHFTNSGSSTATIASPFTEDNDYSVAPSSLTASVENASNISYTATLTLDGGSTKQIAGVLVVIPEDDGTTPINNTATGTPTISGNAWVGSVLTAGTASIADADGLGPFSYQWHRSGLPIDGATSSSYVLTQADQAETITVEVSFTDQLGNAEGPISSPSTATITAAPAEGSYNKVITTDSGAIVKVSASGDIVTIEIT